MSLLISAKSALEPPGDSLQSLNFELDMPHSSGVAVRILPSVHTNPIFVDVGNKPVRASRRSAGRCVKALDVCWNARKGQLREAEQAESKAAYDSARTINQKILAESVAD